MQRNATEQSTQSLPRLYDMHCHLEFVESPAQVARELAELAVHAFSTAVTPQEYECLHPLIADEQNISLGIGMHPWWIADGLCGNEDLGLFKQLAASTRFIGEVGLDFGSHRESTRDTATHQLQVDLLAGMLSTAQEGSLISLHAIRSVTTVLDLLEKSGRIHDSSCIIHWFSGSSEELQRAIKMGCYFSVGPRMLMSKRGREYAKAIPLTRLLLETDYPPEEGEVYTAQEHRNLLESALNQIAELRRMPKDELCEKIAQTSRTLIVHAAK